MNTLNTRAKVIAALEKVQQGQSSSVLLEDLLNSVAPAEKGFAHELFFGTLRQWWALSRIGESLIDKELSDKGIWAALNSGLYQLLYMQIPDYACINDTVEALKQLDKGYAAGLVNAILRKVAKSPQKFAKKIAKNHSLPNWLAKQLKQDWGDYYADIGQTLRQVAPIFLRVNTQLTTVDNYADLLTGQGIDVDKVATGIGDEPTLRLSNRQKITDLPHFADGWVSVQDLHAQLSALILGGLPLAQPSNVLDACTAPGGKLAHLLERFHVKQFSQVIALDNDKTRLGRVDENLERLHLNDRRVKLVCDDASTFCVDEKFDLIVLDAPCTATGVIRRHPDIGLLRTQNDVAQTVALQSRILSNCWQNLATGGYLLYITCSLLKAENEQQMQAFLSEHHNAKAVDFELTLPNQIKQAVGYQCLPLDNKGGDGFYYALLTKTKG